MMDHVQRALVREMGEGRESEGEGGRERDMMGQDEE